MEHITIDAYYGDERRLDDIKSVNSVLNEIVHTLQLRAVMPPFLLPYDYAKQREDDGITAFVILEGGHITAHTFPKRGCIFVDLLYGGKFDKDKLAEIIRLNFLCTELHTACVERKHLNGADKSIPSTPSGKDFGPHTVAKIVNVAVTFEEIFDMLDDIPAKIGMTPICRPYVIKSHACNTSYISGIVLIAQSHVAFHYDTAQRTLYCDAFSCSFYKSENFVKYLSSRYGGFEHMTLIRGSNHAGKTADRNSQIKLPGERRNNCTKGKNNGL